MIEERAIEKLFHNLIQYLYPTTSDFYQVVFIKQTFHPA